MSSSSLNNGQQVRHNLAVVGKFSKACVVTYVPHIADFIENIPDDSLHTPHSLASRGSYTIFEHDETNVAASAVPSGHRRQRSDDYSNGTISKTIQESMVFHRRSSSQDSASDQVHQLQARVRSDSASSNNSSVSSTAGRTPHQYYLSLNQTRHSSLLNKSRQLTTHSNNSIYSQITTTIAVAFSCSHTIVLLTRRRHAYYLEIISREANRDSLSCGNPQPSVHKILPLPIGLVPATMSTQDIVRLVSGGDGTDSHNDSFVSKSGISASRRNSRTRTTPTNSISRAVPHTPGSTAPQSGALRINTSMPGVHAAGVPDQVGDLDSNSSSHSSVNASVNNSTGVHFLNRTNSVFNMDPVGGAAGSSSSRGDSCVAVVSTTNNIFLAYQITPIYSVSSIGGSGSSPRHHSSGAVGVSVTDYQIIELYTVGLNELSAATANPSSNAQEPKQGESKSEPGGAWLSGDDAGFVMKTALFPLNTAIYDFQKSRLSKFKSLQLPYLCLLLLTRYGSVHLIDPYEKTATPIVSTSAAAVVDISHVSAHVIYGCVSHRTNTTDETGVESPGRAITYNDLFVLHTNDSAAPDTLFATFSHKDDSMHLSERDESQSAADSVVLSHLETDELFFVNLAAQRTEADSGTRREDDGVRLVSLQIPTDLEKTKGSTYAGHISSSGSGGHVCVLRHSPVALEGLLPAVDGLCVVGEVLCHKTSLAADMFLSFLEKHSALDAQSREANLEEEVAAPAKKLNTSPKSRTMRVATNSGGSDVGESELSAVLLDIMQSVLNCHLVCPSSNSALLDTLETSLRVVIADNHKLRTVQNKQASALRNTVSSEDYFTSYLFQCCPLLLVELLTRVGRKLEPTISKQIFPVSLGTGSEHSPPQKLGILSLYQYCLANNFINYSGRLLSLVCEHCGGSEKHQSTVLSLLLALEFLHCSMACVSLGNVVECVEFCHRLEDMLQLHCGDIFGRSGNGQTFANGLHGGLTHSYVETIFTRSLAHLQRLHARAVTSRTPQPRSSTQLEQETQEKPAPFYIGKNVVWLLSSLFPADSSVGPAVPSAPTNKPPAISVLSMKNPSQLRSSASSTHQSILQPYQFRSAELLQSQYGTHAISEILCQDSMNEASSALPSSITMCLVTATIRNYFSSSGHYMSAALLVCSLLRSSISKQMVFKTLSQRRHSAYILRTESQEDGHNSIWLAPDQKVRRILFILRLNKILARGDATTIRHALLGTGGAQSYNAQALRRLVEGETVHFHTSAHGGPHGFSATPRDTPRFFVSHGGDTPSLTDHHQVDRSSYFELSDDLFSQPFGTPRQSIATAVSEAPSRDALSAMELLKALVVGFLLVGDDHCAYLLCKVILPYLVVAIQTSDEVLGAVFRPETTDLSGSSPLTDREHTSERFCIRSAESQAQLVGLLLK